ncbi:unnamed protein product [Prorocentrum cordatum]|uniref:Uncharacterized protein n=1 Tax=Prorocentrum cordatum TaxID=2364126 RepID=A0ABN9PAF5_9DINO|nr:unnamed protein product [Polarella glacialis]
MDRFSGPLLKRYGRRKKLPSVRAVLKLKMTAAAGQNTLAVARLGRTGDTQMRRRRRRRRTSGGGLAITSSKRRSPHSPPPGRDNVRSPRLSVIQIETPAPSPSRQHAMMYRSVGSDERGGGCSQRHCLKHHVGDDLNEVLRQMVCSTHFALYTR